MVLYIGVIMNLKDVRLEDLYLDPNNVRLHDERNLDSIKGSLKRFGQQKNIVVDEKGVIIAGNGTYTAAKDLGWKTLKCNITTLEAFEKMAFALADNRTAELAAWDMPALQEQLHHIKDAKLIGFDDDFTAIEEGEETQEVSNTPSQDEKLEKYLKREFFEIKLIYSKANYENITDALDMYLEANSLESYSECIANLLGVQYEHHNLEQL